MKCPDGGGGVESANSTPEKRNDSTESYQFSGKGKVRFGSFAGVADQIKARIAGILCSIEADEYGFVDIFIADGQRLFPEWIVRRAIEDVEAVASGLEHLAGDLQEVLEKFDGADNELTQTVYSVILDLFGKANQLNDWCDRVKEELSL